MQNNYQKYSKIGSNKYRKIIHYFSCDFSATATAKLTKISIRSVNKVYLRIREIITKELAVGLKELKNMDKTQYYLGIKFSKSDETSYIIFGVFKVNNKIVARTMNLNQLNYVLKIIGMETKNKQQIFNLIKKQRNYYGIVDILFKWQKENSVNMQNNCLNQCSVKSFISFARSRIIKINGIAIPKFHLHLKETELRYVLSNVYLYKKLLKLLRQDRNINVIKNKVLEQLIIFPS